MKKSTRRLFEAAKIGDVHAAMMAIEQCADVNAEGDGSLTPLDWAVIRGHLQMAEMLVEKGADVNAKDNHGRTPLRIMAAIKEREEVAEMLRAHGAHE